MSSTYDFETEISDKEKFLFYGHSCMFSQYRIKVLKKQQIKNNITQKFVFLFSRTSNRKRDVFVKVLRQFSMYYDSQFMTHENLQL